MTNLITEDHHRNGGHGEMTNTWASLRNKYWVVKGAMTVLPEERLSTGNSLFYFTGVDYFVPLYVKQGRKLVKRYGCLFTCLTMRAVHIEIASNLSSSLFINAPRRFIGRRGKPRKIFSDNGTSLVGAEKELRKAMDEFDSSKVDTVPT